VKTNTIIITETASRLSDIVRYVRDLDRRTPQVAIRAKIISVDRTATQELGVSYDVGTPATFQQGLVPRLLPGGQTPVQGSFRINLAGDAFSGVANANRLFQQSSALSLIFNTVLRGYNLTSFLDALSSEQLSDVQAEPSTTTIDNRTATLFAGSEIAFLLTPPIVPGQLQAVAPQIFRQRVWDHPRCHSSCHGEPPGESGDLRRAAIVARDDGGRPEHQRADRDERGPGRRW